MTTLDFDIVTAFDNMSVQQAKHEALGQQAGYVPDSWEDLCDDALAAQDGVLSTLSTDSIYVGELQERWEFCSDHLPVGARITDESGVSFNIGSWNVLNQAYMSWVEQDSQGLSRSKILEKHYLPSSKPGLTLREEESIKLIQQMLNDPKNPKDILMLQECGWQFTTELMAILSSTNSPFRVMKHTGAKYTADQNLILYDSRKFDLVSAETTYHEFKESSGGQNRPFLTVLLRNKETGKFYKVCNTHLPGDPKKNAPEEFAQAIKIREPEGYIVLAGGDMNFDNERMRAGFDRVFGKDKSLEYFQAASRYNTNISPKSWEEGAFMTKSIDHIWTKDPSGTTTFTPLKYDEVLEDESFYITLQVLHTEVVSPEKKPLQ